VSSSTRNTGNHSDNFTITSGVVQRQPRRRKILHRNPRGQK